MARNKSLQTMTDEDGTDCAWCNQHKGIPQGEGSHSVCDPHAELSYIRYKVSKVPSAIDEDAAEQRSRSLFQR
jgi:hypothetical protein